MVDHHVTFIVNPHSNSGRTRKMWDDMLETINDTLSLPFDHVIADGIGTGVKETQKAIENGSTIIAAVGGEGTTNEVVNGIMKSDNDAMLGLIRAGTVNDYHQTVNQPRDFQAQLGLIDEVNPQLTPLTKLETPKGEKYGLNMVDAGLSARIAYDASVRRQWLWISRVMGAWRYHILAVKCVLGWKNKTSTILIDDSEYNVNLSILAAGFSYELGGYRFLPHANPEGDKLAYFLAHDFSRPKMIRLMPVLKRGDHEKQDYDNLKMGFASSISVYADKQVHAEADGEPLLEEVQELHIKAKPDAINVLRPELEIS